MKNLQLLNSVRTLMLTLFATFLGVWASAQETGGSSVNVTTTKSSSASAEGWYASPWIWVVGAAVFILLLVALLNNRGRAARD
jgi:hypothetical protein